MHSEYTREGLCRKHATNVPAPDDRSSKTVRTPRSSRKQGPQGYTDTRASRRRAALSSLDDRRRPDHVLAIEIRPELFRNDHGSVFLLIVFDDCNPRPADREAGSV